MWRMILAGAFAVAVLAMPSSAQGRGAVAGQRCPGCDSLARAGATVRSRDSEISNLTVQLAENRILVEHLRARLADGAPEAPRNERERAELQSKLVVYRRAMERLESQLSALCGDASAVRGYIGFNILVNGTGGDSAGRVMMAMSHPIVTHVDPGSPAARSGIVAYDTIISINQLDSRVQSLAAFVRQPGEKVTFSLTRGDVRREVTVTVAPKPPSFGGSCMQFRNVVFADPMGQSFASVRPAGARGSGGAVTGAVRARTNAGGGGEGGGAPPAGQRQPVRIQLSPDSMMQGATFFVIPSGADAAALFMPRGATGAIVAGAEVALINGGLKTVFAVDHGALVVNVAPRSPAEQAGILSGDVIVRAQGEEVTAISVLQRAIQAARDRRSVTLDVVRAKQPKQITLRW